MCYLSVTQESVLMKVNIQKFNPAIRKPKHRTLFAYSLHFKLGET